MPGDRDAQDPSPAARDDSNVATVDVKDGKILRVRRFDFGETYDLEKLNRYRLEKDGHVFEEPTKKARGRPCEHRPREGYAAPDPIAVNLEASLNLGDLPLKRA